MLKNSKTSLKPHNVQYKNTFKTLYMTLNDFQLTPCRGDFLEKMSVLRIKIRCITISSIIN